MKWYHYPKIAGLLSITIPLAFGESQRLLLVLGLHLLCDFALQNDFISRQKARDGLWLLIHSGIAGFLPVAIVLIGNPANAMVAGLVSWAIHYWVDKQDKFGLPMTLGVLVDQLLHVLTLTVLMTIC